MKRTQTTEISTNETERLGERIVNLLSLLDLKYEFTGDEHDEILEAVKNLETKAKENQKPLNLLLFCPNCGNQHIDHPQPEKNWTNPPHKSHECQYCLWVWRPADVPTNGVAVISTKGQHDNSSSPMHDIVRLVSEVEGLKKLINTPHTGDFMEALPLEAAHQIARWGTDHDEGKEPTDWLWVIGYLAGKATNAAINNNLEKAKHHTISTAAVCLNWYRRIVGDEKTFRPGIERIQSFEEKENL